MNDKNKQIPVLCIHLTRICS